MPARRGCFFYIKGWKRHELQNPRLDGEYIHVYAPSPDVFAGPDSADFKAGEQYEHWVPNDFSVVRGQDGWHLIGITHPRPPRFLNTQDVPPEIHEAEWQLFHARCQCRALREALRLFHRPAPVFAARSPV